MVTKNQLTERKRGKGGSLVRVNRPGREGVYVVKDLMTRKQFNKPDRIGVGPVDRGIAFGVSLSEIELV